jgi:hypothetical protein
MCNSRELVFQQGNFSPWLHKGKIQWMLEAETQQCAAFHDLRTDYVSVYQSMYLDFHWLHFRPTFAPPALSNVH